MCQVWLKLAQWFRIRRYFKTQYLLYETWMVLHLIKLESHSTKNALCQVWLKSAQWFWRKGFFNFVNVFSLYGNYLPWKRVRPFIWTILNSLHPGMLCVKFGWSLPSGSGEEDFYISSIYFCYLVFCNYLPLEREGPFVWTNLNLLYPRMHCAKFGWNWPNGSRGEIY